MSLRVVRYEDVGRYAELVRPLLRRDEARNNLPLGVLWQLENTDVYDSWHLHTVEDGTEIRGVLLRTPPWPWNVTVLDGAEEQRVAEFMADHLVAIDAEPADVNGRGSTTGLVARRWAERIGGVAERNMAMRVMSCEQVAMPAALSGERRRADADDVELVRDWLVVFQDEVFDHPVRDIGALEERVRRTLSTDDHGTWLWEDDGEVVSLAGIGRPTGTGERVGPVYTPPEHRGRGYAGRLVAEVSADALGRGLSHVFLFTDAANPVSNALYERIGYHEVGSAAIWTVSAPPAD